MTIIELARQFRKFIEQMSVNATDEEALNNIEAFPKWEVGKLYDIIGERIRYNDKLYKVLTEHRSQADWTPDVAVSLYVKVHQQDPGDEWPEYVQPTGVHDAYMTGDKVTFEGEHYICQIDNCVWSPRDYPAGWLKVE